MSYDTAHSQRAAARAVDICFAAVPSSVAASNSVRHAELARGELVRVGATCTNGVVRLEVTDPGSTGTIAVRNPDARHGGFGLRLVEALAHAWGVCCDGHTRVWVELVCVSATGARDA
jgi:hypothetical protein